MSPINLPSEHDKKSISDYIEAIATETFTEIGLDNFNDANVDEIDDCLRIVSEKINNQLDTTDIGEDVRSAIIQNLEGDGDVVVQDLQRRIKGEDFNLESFISKILNAKYKSSSITSFVKRVDYLAKITNKEELFEAYKNMFLHKLEGINTDELPDLHCFIIEAFAENYAKFENIFGQEEASVLKNILYEQQIALKKRFFYDSTMQDVYDKEEVLTMRKESSELVCSDAEDIDSFIEEYGLASFFSGKLTSNYIYRKDEFLAILKYFGKGYDKEIATCLKDSKHMCYDDDLLKDLIEKIDKDVPLDEQANVWNILFDGEFVSINSILDSSAEYDKTRFLRVVVDYAFKKGENFCNNHLIVDLTERCAELYDTDEFMKFFERLVDFVDENNILGAYSGLRGLFFDNFENIFKIASDETALAVMEFWLEQGMYGRMPVEALNLLLESSLPDKLDHIIAWKKDLGSHKDFDEIFFSSSASIDDKEKVFIECPKSNCSCFWKYIAPELDNNRIVEIAKHVCETHKLNPVSFMDDMPTEDKETAILLIKQFIKNERDGGLTTAEKIFNLSDNTNLKSLVFEILKQHQMEDKDSYSRNYRELDWINKAYYDGKFSNISTTDSLEILSSSDISDQYKNAVFCYDILYKDKDSEEYQALVDLLYSRLSSKTKPQCDIEEFKERLNWYLGIALSLINTLTKGNENTACFLQDNLMSKLLEEENFYDKFKSVFDQLSTYDDDDIKILFSEFGFKDLLEKNALSEIEELFSFCKEIGNVYAVSALKKLEYLYKNNDDIKNGLIEVAKKGGDQAVKAMGELSKLYMDPKMDYLPDDFFEPKPIENFVRVKNAILEISSPRILSDAKNCFEDDIECFEYFCKIAKDEQPELISHFNYKNSAIYKSDLKRFKIGEIFSDKYGLEKSPKLIASYIDTALKYSAEKADEIMDLFLTELPALKLRTIGSEIDLEIRNHPFYLALLEEVFGKDTNYTNIEKNLLSGDAEENLRDYVLPEGRRKDLVLNETNGYKLKDGEAEDLEKQGTYMHRVNAVFDFVRKRQNDKEKLKEDYAEKVDEFFDATLMKTHIDDQTLSIHDKLLIVVLDQGIKKQKKDEVLDLLVLYKFIYEFNIDDFVNETADRVQSGINEVSKHFQQWLELQEVYGENLKHSLEHEIFPGVEKDQYSKIKDIYLKLVLDINEEVIDQKSEDKIRSLLENTRIPTNNLPRAISSSLIGCYTRGLSPKTQEGLRPEITNKVNTYFDKFGDERPSFEDLGPLFGDLHALFLRTKFDPEFQLSELAKVDYNRITYELGKYEENLSTNENSKTIEGYFSMTQEAANARMTSILCLGEDEKMYKNPNYFQFVLKEGETGDCLGLTMFLSVQNKDGKKYLFFAPNPSALCLEKYSEAEVFRYLKRVAIDFAKDNEYDAVVIPANEASIYGGCTNRGGKFLNMLKRSRIKDKDGFKTVDFDEKAWLSQGNFSYGYEAGALIWENTENK